VAQARRYFSTRQVGHAGTLDPLASGVLLLLIGEATKLSSYLTLAHKAYHATIQFGSSTDTFDADGRVVAESSSLPFSDEHLERCLNQERHRSAQIPPAHSAIKIAGKPAYSLARRGIELDLPARAVEVKHLGILERTETTLRLELQVSKGYYVRALVRDLCEALGVAGHLSALRRTESGCFSLLEANPWPVVNSPPRLLSLGEAVQRAMPYAQLTPDGELRARQGKLLDSSHFAALPAPFSNPELEPGALAWLNGAGDLVAIGTREDAAFRVQRGFNATAGAPEAAQLEPMEAKTESR
jgi:tRNA pseudouridine55 synthase